MTKLIFSGLKGLAVTNFLLGYTIAYIIYILG